MVFSNKLPTENIFLTRLENYESLFGKISWHFRTIRLSQCWDPTQTIYFSEGIGVGHDSSGCADADPEYNKKRLPSGREMTELKTTINKLWYQRNYLSCIIDTVWINISKLQWFPYHLAEFRGANFFPVEIFRNPNRVSDSVGEWFRYERTYRKVQKRLR